MLEGSEITKPVLEALSPVTEPLISEIIKKYDIQLRRNGEYLTDWEKERLEREIKNDMIIKLNLSINLTKKKMDTWEIFPKSENQTELNFEGEGEAQREQLKQGAYYEVSGLNQGEDEEVPGDPEGGEEAQITKEKFETEAFMAPLLGETENPDYLKRLRACISKR